MPKLCDQNLGHKHTDTHRQTDRNVKPGEPKVLLMISLTLRLLLLAVKQGDCKKVCKIST